MLAASWSRTVQPHARRRTLPLRLCHRDGTARELHASERQYLETEFRGGDGAMPYIKNSYSERDGWSEISSYLSGRSSPPAP